MFFAVEKNEKLLQELRLAMYREAHPIIQWRFWEGERAGGQQPDLDDRDWAPFTLGDPWGGYDVIAWFRTTLEIPAHLRDRKLALQVRIGPKDSGNSNAEALLYVDGAALQALDAFHHEAWLPPEIVSRGSIKLAMRAWSGVLDIPQHRHFRVANLVQIDEPTERLVYCATTLIEAVKQLDSNDLRRVELLRMVDHALQQIAFTPHDPDRFYGSIADSEQWLQAQLQQMQQHTEIAPTVIGIGHSHIDLAWLWRLSHAREKAGRTFSTVLHHMRQYPDYHFLQASPQLYKFVAQDYPDIFAGIKQMVQAGRWEVTGGMWVEADCNIPNGESLVRQILLGKRYIQAEFGVDSRVLWLPDVFGYPWSLPQVMRKSGLDYFMTTKISWNQTNRFPYDTFTWRGIDGSDVLAHFVTTPEVGARHYTYNGQITPHDVKGVWDHYRQKTLNDELMLIYGWGDGGGGPTKEMLESAKTLRSIPGLPRFEMGKAELYFARLQARVADQELPTWDGELYLEFHRGTYTSQAQSKRANRTAEVLYHDAEWLCALADVLLHQQAYPAHALRTGWELLLLNQFHDILPGSSIRQVYEDSHAQYAEVERIGRSVLHEASTSLVRQIGVDQASVVVLNSLGWSRAGLIECDYDRQLVGKTIHQPDGQKTSIQVIERDGEAKLLVSVTDVPALGYRAYPIADDQPTASPAETLIVQPRYLENQFYQISIAPNGQIAAIVDKAHGRDVLSGPGNVLQAFQDKPMAFDAWDIDQFYQEKMQPVDDLIEAEVEETGPLRGVLRVQWRFGRSTITQRITLYADSPRIDFRTEVDWHEQQVLLKAAFPVAVRTTKATYDIQWGNIERPTHWNTSWDWARFESVAHKWIDLSEGNYGVALLNDCKYGHDVKDNVLRITLIKSPVRPDPQADQGRHVFTYSLLPHGGDWRNGDVARLAYNLNYPLHSQRLAANSGGRLPRAFAWAELDTDHVMIETVKQAEDDGAWIVRVYEYKQCRNQRVALTFGTSIAQAVECSLMEKPESEVDYQGRRLTFAITPYEIKTFKVWLNA